ncbi:hypothetical protein BDD43_1107 [Mucilaginibacter gracilis]|uniref:Uncharacterized protein n=1 Tax=Mucilaginibacter gracilis TaxID=423350 RepID=A0A495IY14_9SPHI|nr:hypothetical protein BDD43_1107 [Mucilaginibacter gracilis]
MAYHGDFIAFITLPYSDYLYGFNSISFNFLLFNVLISFERLMGDITTKTVTIPFCGKPYNRS